MCASTAIVTSQNVYSKIVGYPLHLLLQGYIRHFRRAKLGVYRLIFISFGIIFFVVLDVAFTLPMSVFLVFLLVFALNQVIKVSKVEEQVVVSSIIRLAIHLVRLGIFSVKVVYSFYSCQVVFTQALVPPEKSLPWCYSDFANILQLRRQSNNF